MSAAAEGLAGAAGAVIATVATYPLTTISTVQAVSGETRWTNHQSRSKLTILWEDICQIIEDRGLGGLYDGLKPAMLGAALSQGVYFFFYSALRDLILFYSRKSTQSSSESIPALGVAGSLAVASLAGSINVLLTNPIWVLATRMQANPRRSRGQSVVKAIKDLYTSEGYKWIFKGLVPSLVMVCNPTVQYAIYEWLMKRLSRDSKKGVSSLEIFLASATAKIGATLATYPLILVKSRLQVSGQSGLEEFQYEGTLDAIKSILREEGVLGFYKGMGARMLASVLAAALLLMIKEKLANEVKTLMLSKKKKL